MLNHLCALVFSFASATAAIPTPPGGSVLEAIEREQTALFHALAPSVVFIVTPDGFGSGFFVGEHGEVLTNLHVVGAHASVTVVLQNGRSYHAPVVARGEDEVDVALVKVPRSGTPAAKFAASTDVPIGAWVSSIGHGRGGIWTFNVGIVSNAHGERNRGVLQTQIPLNPGASGGPVFDRAGRVVGIVTSGIEGANAINFALTPEVAAAALPALRPLANYLTIHAPEHAPVFVEGRLVGQGPLVVVVAQPGDLRIEAQVGSGRRAKTARFPRQREVDLR